jgi:hypothetical protein
MVTSHFVHFTGARLLAKKGSTIGQIGITLSLNRAEDILSDGLDFLRSEKNAGLGDVHALKVFTGQVIALRRAVRGIGVAREVRHPGSRTTALHGLHNLRLLEVSLA